MSRSAPTTEASTIDPGYITVPTTTGFNQGDLVYAKNGDYASIPNGVFPYAPFDADIAAPIYSTGSGGWGSIENINGGSKCNYADKLTNGNTVDVYFIKSGTGTGRPAFRIVGPTGSIVVAETEMSTVFVSTGASSIGVCALSGGGFAAFWINSAGGAGAGYPNYAIYSNTGVVVTATTQDTGAGAGSTANPISGVALPLS